MSRLSSAILFQYNHPTEVSIWPPSIRNYGPRSVITRACQGFLQRVAFPLQFEYLFSFPGDAVDPTVFAEVEAGDFRGPGGEEAAGPRRRGEVEGELGKIPLADWMKKYW